MPSRPLLTSNDLGAVGVISLHQDVVQACTMYLTRAMNDESCLGIITRGTLKAQIRLAGEKLCVV